MGAGSWCRESHHSEGLSRRRPPESSFNCPLDAPGPRLRARDVDGTGIQAARDPAPGTCLLTAFGDVSVVVLNRERISCTALGSIKASTSSFQERQTRLRTEIESRSLIPSQVVGMGMVPSNNHVERQPSHKATLYCPSCKHESLINGSWIIHVHSNRLDYECPKCGVVIESRSDGPDVVTPA